MTAGATSLGGLSEDAMKASKVEIIPTKRRLGGKNVGERGLFVHPDVAKIHVEVAGEARYVTAEDDPQKYMTRDMTAGRRPRTARVTQDPAPVRDWADYKAPTPEPTATNTESEAE
jgi:hypothetical protein